MSDNSAHERAGKDNPEDYGEPHDSLVPAHPAEPIADPGLPEHEPRPTDIDEAMERRAERQVAGMFVGASLLLVLFVVVFFAVDDDAVFMGMGAHNLAIGLTFGLAMLLIGVGAIQWAKKLMSDHEIVEYRHSAESSQADREETLAAVSAGAEESGFGRRTLVRNSLLGSLALLGLPAVVLLRDLGPLPGTVLERTVWRRGVRVVEDVSGEPIRPADMQVGELINAEPGVFFEHEGPNGEIVPSQYEGAELNNAKAKAAVIVVRMHPDDITPLPYRENWGVEGILCYSKICTHLGCPISLWEQQTQNVLCPCHQSTFALADNGKVLFGPASRSLPQLPLGVDEEGYLIAMSDFLEPVGPSYWERGEA